MTSPLAFRNVARYVRDVDANLPLYRALGFEPVRRMGDMAVLANAEGVRLVLHAWDAPRAPAITDTALGFTVSDVRAAREHVEKAGWRLLRAPDAGDEGFFFIYGDLDGNPVNLVGERPR